MNSINQMKVEFLSKQGTQSKAFKKSYAALMKKLIRQKKYKRVQIGTFGDFYCKGCTGKQMWVPLTTMHVARLLKR